MKMTFCIFIYVSVRCRMKAVFIRTSCSRAYAALMTKVANKFVLSLVMWAFIVFVPAHISFAMSYAPQSYYNQYQLHWCNGYYSYSPCTYSYYYDYYPTYYSYYDTYSYYDPYSYYYPTYYGYGYNYNSNYNYNGNYNYNYNGFY